MWGKDMGDLASPRDPAEEIILYTLCEGCGPTVVNKQGECIGDCDLHHGTMKVQTMREFVQGVLPDGRKVN